MTVLPSDFFDEPVRCQVVAVKGVCVALADLPVLAPRARGVAAPPANGECIGARVEVVEGFLLDRVGGDGADVPVRDDMKPSVDVEARSTVPALA